MKTRVIALHPRAKAYLINNGIHEPCGDCGKVHPNGCPKSEDVGTILGADNETTVTLRKYFLTDGNTVTEFLQKQILDDDGTTLVIGYRLDETGFEIRWTDEEIANKLREQEARAKANKIKRKLHLCTMIVMHLEYTVIYLKQLTGETSPQLEDLLHSTKADLSALERLARQIFGEEYQTPNDTMNRLKSAIFGDGPKAVGPLAELLAPVEDEEDEDEVDELAEATT